MKKSIFKVLGTAAAEVIPTLFCSCPVCYNARKKGGRFCRLRSGYAIDNTVRIDFGPDAQSQSSRFGLDGKALKYLFITHSHFDHFMPNDLECVRYLPEKLNFYGNAAVITKIKEFYFAEKMDLHTLEPGDRVEVPELEMSVTALAAHHIPTETALLYLLERGDRRILIAHDTEYLPEDTLEKLRGKILSYIFFDGTWGEGDRGCGHMGIPAIKREMEKLRTVGAADGNTQAYPVHLGHVHASSHETLSMTPAYDGMEVEW